MLSVAGHRLQGASSLRERVARGLEEGRLGGALARCLSLAWAEVSARSVVRPLRVPEHVRVVTVGGATLGGSGKTPLAIACAGELARQGARVALVGHAYGARPGRARVVSTADPLAEVGDEALVAAQKLAGQGVPIVVAPRREAAVELAAGLADVLVIDGPLQLSPRRADLALLAVDAEEPWGRAAAVPPRGDLRAPVPALLAAADLVVRVGPGSPDTIVTSAGAYLGHTLLPWDALRPLRVGLACALARPDRLLRALAREGIAPAATAFACDHGPLAPREPGDGTGPSADARVDLWLASAKCALHLGPTRAPVATLDHAVVCAPTLASKLSAARLDPRGCQQ